MYNFIMFRIEKEEMTNKTFRLPMTLVDRMYIIAQSKGVSLNSLVRQCCEYALNNLDDEDNPSKK